MTPEPIPIFQKPQNFVENFVVFAVSGGHFFIHKSTLLVGNEMNILATSSGASGTDLFCLIPTYVASFPTDPDSSIVYPDTGYTVNVNSVGRVTVCALKSMSENAISGNNGSELCITH